MIKRAFRLIPDRVQLVAASYLAQAIRIGTTLIMARLLTPRQYGTIALLSIVPGYFAAIGDLGVARSIVQIKDLPQREVQDTGFVLGLCLSFLTALSQVGSGYFLWRHHGNIEFLWLGFILATTTLFASVYSFQMACISRDMRFAFEARQQVVLAGVTSITAIAFAQSGWGVYALGFQTLAAQLVANMAVIVKQPLHFPSHFRWSVLRRLVHSGSRISIASLLGGLQQNVFNTVVGGLLGATALGFSNKAAQIRDLVQQNTLSVFDRILYPVLSHHQKSPEDLRRSYLSGQAVIALLGIGGASFVYNLSDELVAVVLGAQWGSVPPVVQALALGAMVSWTALPATIVTLARGEIDTWIRVNLLGLCLVILSLALVMNRGLFEMSLAYAVSSAITGSVFHLYVLRSMKINLREALVTPMLLLLVGLACYAVVAAARQAIPAGTVPIDRLIILGSVGGISFALLTCLVRWELVHEVRAVLGHRIQPLPPVRMEL